MQHPTLRLLRWFGLVTFNLALGAAASSAALAQTYWFERYERAVALIDAGQVGEASTLLERVIKDHPIPIACLRVPGDRCIDYVPYFERARIQIYRGDTRGASHSLDVSEAFGTRLQNKRTEREIHRLREQIRTMEETSRSAAPATAAPVAPVSDPH